MILLISQMPTTNIETNKSISLDSICLTLLSVALILVTLFLSKKARLRHTQSLYIELLEKVICHAIPTPFLPISLFHTVLIQFDFLYLYTHRNCSAEDFCRKYFISRSTIHEWLKLYSSHIQEWINLLKSSDKAFGNSKAFSLSDFVSPSNRKSTEHKAYSLPVQDALPHP